MFTVKASNLTDLVYCICDKNVVSISFLEFLLFYYSGDTQRVLVVSLEGGGNKGHIWNNSQNFPNTVDHWYNEGLGGTSSVPALYVQLIFI
jgi:hypothetical protein